MSKPTRESLAEAREIIGMLEPDSRVPILARRLDELKAERAAAEEPWREALKEGLDIHLLTWRGTRGVRVQAWVDQSVALLAAQEEV